MMANGCRLYCNKYIKLKEGKRYSRVENKIGRLHSQLVIICAYLERMRTIYGNYKGFVGFVKAHP